MSNVPPRRCIRHDLAVAPDGQCIVCRREQSVAAVPMEPESTRSLPLWGLSVALLMAAGGAAAWRILDVQPNELPRIAVARPAPVKPEPAAAAAPKPAPAAEDDLAVAMRMLDEAERDRRALESAIEQRAEESRTAATAARKREELERDAKRHEAVKRELDGVALASARRKVSITMYSTRWCGVCKRARAYMEQQRIAFTELDIDRDAAARARAHTLNPRDSMPTIAVDDEVLIGFSPDSLETRITRAAKRRAGS